eukprot:305878-Prymnesium_polylepis.1
MSCFSCWRHSGVSRSLCSFGMNDLGTPADDEPSPRGAFAASPAEGASLMLRLRDRIVAMMPSVHSCAD